MDVLSVNLRYLTRAAIVAAIYIALVVGFAPWSFGVVQFRPAEALTVLPILFPEAVPGLFVGVMLSNIIGGLGPCDIFGGSLVTLLAAYVTYRFRDSWIAFASPIVFNALLISLYLRVIFQVPYWITVLSIGLSEALSVLGLGLPLIWMLRRRSR